MGRLWRHGVQPSPPLSTCCVLTCLPPVTFCFIAAPHGVVEALLEEQRASLELLRSGGTIKNFDLPMGLLDSPLPPTPAAHSSVATADGDPDPLPLLLSDASASVNREARNTACPGSHQKPRVGDIAFFNADEAPFVLGEVLSIDASASPTNINIHWYGPINSKVRAEAARTSVAAYAASRFSADFILTGNRVNNRKGRKPDVSDEPMTGVIACCQKLTGTGRIPAKLQQLLVDTCAEESVDDSSSEYDSTESAEEGG